MIKKALVFSGGGARGAFQIGVWKYLNEIGWKPDIICGSSIGAINAAGIGSGLDMSTLIRLWTTAERRRIYRLNLMPFLSGLISGRTFNPLFDTRSAQSVLSDCLDFDALRTNSTRIVISAVNVHTGQVVFFDNSKIGLPHILASSAMPILFPWHNIDGIPHWDGGVMANVPLQPALDWGAQKIIVVTLAPVGQIPQASPGTVREAMEHLFEQFLTGSYQTALNVKKYRDQPFLQFPASPGRKVRSVSEPVSQPDILTLSPSKMLGFRSLLNFSLSQARQLIDEGYQTAQTELKNFI